MSASRRVIAAATAIFGLLLAAIAFSAPASSYPVGTSPTLSLSKTIVTPGESLVASGTRWIPGSTVTLTLHSATAPLGTASVATDATFSRTITVPVGTTLGQHRVEANDGRGNDLFADLTVVAPSSGGGGGSSGSGGLSATGIAVISLGGVGALLLIAGGAMLLAGRRRVTA